MLILTTERLALLALDQELAALQASSRTAFFNAIAVTHEAIWPPPPFEASAFEWAARHLAHDPEGEGWFVKLRPLDAFTFNTEFDTLMDEAAYADYVKGI